MTPTIEIGQTVLYTDWEWLQRNQIYKQCTTAIKRLQSQATPRPFQERGMPPPWMIRRTEGSHFIPEDP
jgi:hypothetical protein